MAVGVDCDARRLFSTALTARAAHCPAVPVVLHPRDHCVAVSAQGQFRRSHWQLEHGISNQLDRDAQPVVFGLLGDLALQVCFEQTSPFTLRVVQRLDLVDLLLVVGEQAAEIFVKTRQDFSLVLD
jgi:hypothetical protein